MHCVLCTRSAVSPPSRLGSRKPPVRALVPVRSLGRPDSGAKSGRRGSPGEQRTVGRRSARVLLHFRTDGGWPATACKISDFPLSLPSPSREPFSLTGVRHPGRSDSQVYYTYVHYTKYGRQGRQRRRRRRRRGSGAPPPSTTTTTYRGTLLL